MRPRQTQIFPQKRRKQRTTLNITRYRFPVNSHRYDRHPRHPSLSPGAALRPRSARFVFLSGADRGSRAAPASIGIGRRGAHIVERVGQHVAPVPIDLDRGLQRRDRALVAVVARADAARDSDRLERPGAGQVQIVGIDQTVGVAGLAAQPDGVAARWYTSGTARFADIPREAEISNAVRGLRQLAQPTSRGLEGAMHIPQRAGTAKPRKL
jgi:hypothetical protein